MIWIQSDPFALYSSNIFFTELFTERGPKNGSSVTILAINKPLTMSFASINS